MNGRGLTVRRSLGVHSTIRIVEKRDFSERKCILKIDDDSTVKKKKRKKRFGLE